MKRWDLVISDEYIDIMIECIVISRKKTTDIRKDLNEFLLKYRDELLHGDQGFGCSDETCKICFPF